MMLRTDDRVVQKATKEPEDAQSLFTLLWWLSSLELLGTTELWNRMSAIKGMRCRESRLTFLARFFRSLRSFRVGLSFLVPSPD